LVRPHSANDNEAVFHTIRWRLGFADKGSSNLLHRISGGCASGPVPVSHAVPGNRIIYLSFVILLTLPVQVNIIPLYVVVVRARLANNLLGLILCYTTGSLPLSVFLFKTYFDALPAELLDSARLDGCGDWSTFLRIVVPLSRPIIATTTIFTFVQAWNEFFLALVFIQNR
jgi:multiple sugar transport system permease protein